MSSMSNNPIRMDNICTVIESPDKRVNGSAISGVWKVY